MSSTLSAYFKLLRKKYPKSKLPTPNYIDMMSKKQPALLQHELAKLPSTLDELKSTLTVLQWNPYHFLMHEVSDVSDRQIIYRELRSVVDESVELSKMTSTSSGGGEAGVFSGEAQAEVLRAAFQLINSDDIQNLFNIASKHVTSETKNPLGILKNIVNDPEFEQLVNRSLV
jgi:hypothetical protein